MSRLTWDGRNCTNPPEGWDVAVLWAGPADGFFFSATQLGDGGAQYAGPNVPTEAQARRSCEAALLRLGVLDAGVEWVHHVSRMLDKKGKPFDDNAVIAVARALAALEVEASDG
jgi:hypothetical protein